MYRIFQNKFCKIDYYGVISQNTIVAEKNLLKSLEIFRLQMSSEQNGSPYNPFKYPPDYRLARTHQQASMPGKPDKVQNITCPCCNQMVKNPFKSWWNRSIEKDFKRYGGAVVSYFWLLKLYFISALSVIIIYGGYLHYLSDYYCGHLTNQSLKEQVCSRLFGVWIIANQNLYKLIQDQNDEGTQVRYFTLRSIAFLILLITNVLSLYVVKWFKVRYPTKTNISTFSVFFKNLKSDSIENLLQNIRRKVGQFQYKQAFIIKKVQPFYTKYQEKLQCYYRCRIEDNPKKLQSFVKKLYRLDTVCSQHQQSFYNQGNRAIIVFEQLATKEKVLNAYKITKIHQVQMFFSISYEQQYGTYCQKCPKPQQIIWNNIGVIEKQGFKVKILSVFYFFLILGFLVGFMYFALEVVYLQDIPEPFNSIIQNIILLFLVAVGLTFRGWMNRLSQMRFPNTYTRRTMFIVITTVFFHIIFYLFIPSIFLRIRPDQRGSVLNLISNQSITFIVVQMILAAFDLMYCCWNRKRGIIQNQNKPIGCQKLLHEKMQFPRFPIEFKLIILFKIWSLITLFAFHVPLVLLLVLLALLFLYVKDKMNVYYHYRMQVIDNQVEFKFLRIYSNIFTLYLYETFIFTQHQQLQYMIGAVVTLATIAFQTFYFRKLQDQQPTSNDSFVSAEISDIDEGSSYKQKYESFLNVARSDIIDNQIKEFLSKQGYGTMKTQETVGSQLI